MTGKYQLETDLAGIVLKASWLMVGGIVIGWGCGLLSIVAIRALWDDETAIITLRYVLCLPFTAA